MLINLQNSSTMNKRNFIIFLILVLLISLAACTAGPNTTMDVASPDGHIAGFFLRKKEIPHEFRIRDGSHSWTYWRESLPAILEFVSDAFHQY